jgi:LytS/YehU family sensor histidine kinase
MKIEIILNSINLILVLIIIKRQKQMIKRLNALHSELSYKVSRSTLQIDRNGVNNDLDSKFE